MIKILLPSFLLISIIASAKAGDNARVDEMIKSNIISQVEGQRVKIKLEKASTSPGHSRGPASIEQLEIDDLSHVQMRHIQREIDIIFKKAMDR